MQKALLFLTVVFGLLSGCNKNDGDPMVPPADAEATLFDKERKPVAYIDYADESAPTIYMWDGTPVAYFEGNEDIYHFNGVFLGWYRDGILYNKEGYAVAAGKNVVKGEIDMTQTQIEPVKHVKHVKPVPHVQSLKPAAPEFKNKWSDPVISLAKFFLLEITWFDRDKKAVAYVDYADDSTIYMWDGTPVAYMEGTEKLYRFDGVFLGWYSDEALYDKDGHVVGAERDVVRGEIVMTAPQIEPVKGVKGSKPVKQVQATAPQPPHFEDRWSETSLAGFFLSE